MKDQDLDGWCAADTPVDGYTSEGEFNPQKLVGQQNKKKNKTGCGFQAMGLSQPVLKGILHKGYKVPTPIQRRSIPTILEGKDIVAMARTGSGKTAAFLIPLFERLKLHAAQGSEIRGLILSPTRELALQTLSFAKQLGKYTGIRAAVVLGGDSMEVQFQAITENPDIIIATPGRFMHICVQMNLKLSSVDYVVFDEADRLFEMGFSEQLQDIISRLSPNRQTLLFSATLPKMMVDFARAGLTDPVLIRLDVENKMSANLKMGFFQVKSEERIPLLLHFLKNVIDIEKEPTVVFVPTKHHVEHLHLLLSKEGIPNSYIYSSLDPTARKINTDKFRKKKVNLLIVTDIAARGIDIPLLDNVINFNFPSKTKLFVHRVGRVARAGRSGNAFSFVMAEETAYLLELHMFINKAIKFAPQGVSSCGEDVDWNLVFGKVPRDILDDNIDHIEKLHSTDYDLERLRSSAENGYKKYRKSCPPASHESLRRLKKDLWDSEIGFHPLLIKKSSTNNEDENFNASDDMENKRNDLLDCLKNTRPRLTIFEVKKLGIKSKAAGTAVKFMDDKRKSDQVYINRHHKRLEEKKVLVLKRKQMEEEAKTQRSKLEEVSELQVVDTFSKVIGKRSKKARNEIRSSNNMPLGPLRITEKPEENQHFIPYEQSDRHTEEALAVRSGFDKATLGSTLDIHGDENHKNPQVQRKQWSRTLKKFVGKDMPKKIKTESGVWVNATYNSGDIYQKWKLKSQKAKEGMDDKDNKDEHGESHQSEQKTKGKKGFITLNKNMSSKRHPLLQGKAVTAWNRPGKKKVQQVKSNRELYTYEEMQKNLKHKMQKKRKQGERAQVHKKKKQTHIKKSAKNG